MQQNRALLSRYADSLFWLGRYIERAENIARIVDVTETFSRDARGAQNWMSVVQIYADEARFRSAYGMANAQTVTRFYLLDRENPSSVAFAVHAARENARALRPLISTEMWLQLNVFNQRIQELGSSDISGEQLSRTCDMIKTSCQAHVGITEGTFFRDQGWYFNELGKHIERADQTTRILDIKYHLLLPSAEQVNSPVDVSQWNALLRAVAGYHAFRRLVPRGMTPAAVVGFLLMNRGFPRSVALCVDRVDFLLTRMRADYHLRGGAAALAHLDEMRAVLSERSADRVIIDGLHEFLDAIQLKLSAVTGDLKVSFFGEEPAAA